MQQLGTVAVALTSNLPIERQARVIGATWLDQQLIDGGRRQGQLLAATMYRAGVSWEIGRLHVPFIS